MDEEYYGPMDYYISPTDRNYVITSEYYVRDLPCIYGDVLGTIFVGEKVNVTGICVETGWYRIEYKGDVGYVRGTNVMAMMKEEPLNVPEWHQEYTFTEMNTRMFMTGDKKVYLYTEPSPKASKTSSYWNKDTWAAWVTGQCNETGWYRVDYFGSVAYVPKEDLTFIEPESKYENCPYPLDSWENNGDSITYYYVYGGGRGGAAQTSLHAAKVLQAQNRSLSYTYLNYPQSETVGKYREGTIMKETVCLERSDFNEIYYPFDAEIGLEPWSHCFYVKGANPEVTENIKKRVKENAEYYVKHGGYSYYIEEEIFLGEFTQGPVYWYRVRAVK